MKKILVPFDGSSYSMNSLEFIASRLTMLGREPAIRLLVVQQPLPSKAATLIAPEGVSAYFEADAEKTLKAARKFLKKNQIEVEEHIVQGNPAEMIAQEAADFAADLIIMGSRGRTAFGGLFFGSVTNGVLARTKTPVLILRGKPAPQEDALKVGLCVDGSEFSSAAVQYAMSHKSLFGRTAKYTVLTVSTPYTEAAMPELGFGLPRVTPEAAEKMAEDQAEKAFESVRPIFSKARVKPKEVSLEGNAGEEIARYAKKKLDMLVMGSHGYGRFKAAVMGSVATRVASSGNVPLLIVRE